MKEASIPEGQTAKVGPARKEYKPAPRTTALKNDLRIISPFAKFVLIIVGRNLLFISTTILTITFFVYFLPLVRG
jgi:hypothetical protein